MAWNRNVGTQGTRHKDGCRMAFGKKDPTCPRCQELMAGAESRGWNTGKAREKDFLAALKRHDCKQSNCGPVCTFGDW